jgi:hypothetical protein
MALENDEGGETWPSHEKHVSVPDLQKLQRSAREWISARPCRQRRECPGKESHVGVSDWQQETAQEQEQTCGMVEGMDGTVDGTVDGTLDPGYIVAAEPPVLDGRRR